MSISEHLCHRTKYSKMSTKYTIVLYVLLILIKFLYEGSIELLICYGVFYNIKRGLIGMENLCSVLSRHGGTIAPHHISIFILVPLYLCWHVLKGDVLGCSLNALVIVIPLLPLHIGCIDARRRGRNIYSTRIRDMMKNRIQFNVPKWKI